jgi:hypothetical protein
MRHNNELKYSVEDIKPLISKILGKSATTNLNLSNYFSIAFEEFKLRIKKGYFPEIIAFRKSEINKMVSPQHYSLAMSLGDKVELVELAEVYNNLPNGKEGYLYSYSLRASGSESKINLLKDIIDVHFSNYIVNLIKTEINT